MHQNSANWCSGPRRAFHRRLEDLSNCARPRKPTFYHPPVTVTDSTLENQSFRITVDPQAGTVASVYDKELSKELVDRDAPHQLNQLVARWVADGRLESPGRATVQRGRQALFAEGSSSRPPAAGCPHVTQEVILYDEIKRIDPANRILQDSTPGLELYFAFPFKMDGPEFRSKARTRSSSRHNQFRIDTNYYTVQHWADALPGWYYLQANSHRQYPSPNTEGLVKPVQESPTLPPITNERLEVTEGYLWLGCVAS